MKRATTTTRPITETTRKSVAAAHAATIRSSANQMSHCYITRKITKINRQPRRLEFIVSNRKQTPTPQINRQRTRTSQIQFRHASPSHSPLSTSRCLFHQKAQITAPSMTFSVPRMAAHAFRPTDPPTLIARHCFHHVELAKVRKNNRFADRLTFP